MIPVCPKCDVGLLIVHLPALEVDVCPTCRGLWLDDGELEQLAGPTTAATAAEDPLARLRRDPGAPPPDGRRYLCPRCDQPLRQVVVTPAPAAPAITLDNCPRGHGLWFDAGELPAVLAARPPTAGARLVVDALRDLFGTVPQP